MPYVEYIKVGSGESWPVRDAEAQESLTNMETTVADLETTTAGLETTTASLQTQLNGKAATTHYHNYFPYRTELPQTSLTDLGAKGGGIYYTGSASLTGIGAWVDIVKTGAAGGDGYALIGGPMVNGLYYVPFSSGTPATQKRVLTHILSSDDYGTSFPSSPTTGQLFFKKV